MPDTNELKRWMKVKDLNVGDIIKIIDEGAIREFEFIDSKTKQKEQGKALEIGVTLDGVQRKGLTLNAISIRILSEKWGSKTQMWVGKSVIVKITKMVSFGKLEDIKYLEPIENEKTAWDEEEEAKQ